MNLFFVICTVFGVTLLSCVTLLSVLGLDEKQNFVDQDWHSGGEELVETTTVANESGTGAVPRYRRSALRGLGAGIAFFGLMGCAAHAIHMSEYHTIGLSFLAGTIAFLGVGLLMRQLPFDPSADSFSIQTVDEVENSPQTHSEITDASGQR